MNYFKVKIYKYKITNMWNSIEVINNIFIRVKNLLKS